MNNRLSLIQTRAMFGQPCDRANFTYAHLPILGVKLVHIKVAHQFVGAYRDIEEAGLAHLIVDSGIYNCRKTKVLRRINGKWVVVEGKTDSRHSWAIAADNNAPAYPYGRTRQQPKELRDIFSKWGFEIVVKIDQHHFEIVRIVSLDMGKEIEDMGFRAYQSTRPEKEAFVDKVFTGTGNPLLLGQVYMSVRTDPLNAKANYHYYIIKRNGEVIETEEKTVDHAPSIVELHKEHGSIGDFSVHVESDFPVLVAVDQF